MVLDASADITGGRHITISGELDAASGDFSGDIDVDGTANLDAVDIDGTVQIDGVTTFGVNDTGVDVKMFGATSGRYLLWDESRDALAAVDNVKFEIGSGQDMELYHDGTNSYLANKTGAMKIATETSDIAVTIGHTTSEVTVGDNLTVGGNLTVQGTTTTVNQTIIENTTDVIVFEGSTDDAHETTLKVTEPTADATFALPALSAGDYHIATLADTATAASSAVTAAEFALLDGGTARATVGVADGDGLILNDGGTMKMVTVESLAAYYDDEITAMPNLVSVSALDAGSITSNFGAIDNGTSGIRTNTFTAETSILPDAVGGADIGSTSAEWGDLYMADGKAIKLGNDSEISLTHVADTGLLLAGGDNKLQFRDATEFVASDADGHMIMEGATGVTLAINNSAVAEITSAGLNVAGTLTGDTSLTLDAVTISTAEIGVLDGVTPGTAAASKALVLDGNKDIATIRNLTIDGAFTDGNYTFDTSGNVSGLGTVSCGAITSTGTSTFGTAIEPDADDGATIGSADKNWSDLFLADAAVANFGDDQDVTLTHVADTGLLLNATRQIQFNDSKVAIYKGGSDQMVLKSNNIAYTLPGADGTPGASLQTNGAGALGWVKSGMVRSGSLAKGQTVAAGADVASGPGLGMFALSLDSTIKDPVLGDHLSVFVNGQLLFSGSETQRNAGDCDYTVSGSGATKRLVLSFVLEEDDVVQAIVR
jgi:hypothetical protein